MSDQSNPKYENEQRELEKFLTDAGYGNLLEKFAKQDIATLEAARGLTIQELVEDIGCTKLAASKIYARLHSDPQSPHLTPENSQIVPVQLQMVQLQNENKLAQLEAYIKLQEKNAQHEKEINELKHKHVVENLEKDLKHQKELQQVVLDKTTAVYDAKLAALEEKMKQKLAEPTWWNPAHGPWDPYYNQFPFSSLLLTPQFYRVIQGWLGGRTWELRYRATRDGFLSNNFHSCCDNIGATVTLIRANGYLFGGYTPMSWNSTGSYQNSTGCFLFTLINAHGIPPTNFYSNGTNSILCNSAHGPTFGGGYDIYIASNANSNSSSYSNFPHGYSDSTGKGNNLFAGGKNFTVAEVEVFRVY